MLWNNLLRKGLVMSALGTLILLSACTFTIQPEADRGASTPAPADKESSRGEAMAVAEFVLPDGTSCLFSGTGATVAFDNKRVNYTCTPIISTESLSETLAILDDPQVTGPTEYFVDFAVIAKTEGGFELHSSQVISFTAWQIVLADGRVCLHAGFGATMGFDGQRLNYTCDKGDSTADEVGLMGKLVNQGEGVWLAQIDEIGRDSSGFTQLSSTQVPVAKVSGVDRRPVSAGAPTSGGTDASDELIGTTWQWVQTAYSNDSVVVADDPSRYTLLFDESGQVAVQLDCNGGSGEYTMDGSSLLFGPIASTLIACTADSQATVFAKDLNEVYSYVIEEGHLFLSLKLDTGIMEFAPMEEDVSADSAQSSEDAGGAELSGTTWQWEKSIYEGDLVVSTNDPSLYTITFNDDGSVAVQLDCNSGGGSYTVDGANLTVGPLRSTRMACPEGSQDGVFAEDLAAVVSYTFADGNLHLTLSTDGVMEFSPVE